MQEERRTLQSDVFPIVRRFLWERGITFIDVDLRWGVTREEAEHGDVIGICLREIDRCRPWILQLPVHEEDLAASDDVTALPDRRRSAPAVMHTRRTHGA